MFHSFKGNFKKRIIINYSLNWTIGEVLDEFLSRHRRICCWEAVWERTAEVQLM